MNTKLYTKSRPGAGAKIKSPIGPESHVDAHLFLRVEFHGKMAASRYCSDRHVKKIANVHMMMRDMLPGDAAQQHPQDAVPAGRMPDL